MVNACDGISFSPENEGSWHIQNTEMSWNITLSATNQPQNEYCVCYWPEALGAVKFPETESRICFSTVRREMLWTRGNLRSTEKALNIFCGEQAGKWTREIEAGSDALISSHTVRCCPGTSAVLLMLNSQVSPSAASPAIPDQALLGHRWLPGQDVTSPLRGPSESLPLFSVF